VSDPRIDPAPRCNVWCASIQCRFSPRHPGKHEFIDEVFGLRAEIDQLRGRPAIGSPPGVVVAYADERTEIGMEALNLLRDIPSVVHIPVSGGIPFVIRGRGRCAGLDEIREFVASSASAMTNGPFTAHQCAESEHYREEANRLRDLVGQLDRSNEQYADDRTRLNSTPLGARLGRTSRARPVRMSERLLAWGVIHNSHGTHVDRLCFLPEGDKPDTDIAWVRLPWLDERRALDLTAEEVEALRKARDLCAVMSDPTLGLRAVRILDRLIGAKP
jgi:hypothetical protein